jgi:hypothetical protein
MMRQQRLARRSIPDTPRHRVPLDHPGQLTAIAALGLLTAGLILGGAAGWRSPVTLGALTGAIAAGLGFWRDSRAARWGPLSCRRPGRARPTRSPWRACW